MLMLFLSTLLFTWQIAQKSREIRELRDVLTLKESQRAENMTLANSIQASGGSTDAVQDLHGAL